MIDADVLFQQAAAALRHERRASYRLQLASALAFDEGPAPRPYSGALWGSAGVSLPCSARPRRLHGYDVTGP
jgi:hypothetical protein